MPPECGDPESLKTLKSVISDVLKKKSGFKNVAWSVDRFDASDAHTIAVDEKLHTRSCKVHVDYRISEAALQLIKAPDSDPRLIPVITNILKDSGANISLMEMTQGGTLRMDALKVLGIADKVLIPARTLAEDGKIPIEESLAYSIRRSEDRNSGGDFVVECSISDEMIKVFMLAESFSEYSNNPQATATKSEAVKPAQSSGSSESEENVSEGVIVCMEEFAQDSVKRQACLEAEKKKQKQ